MESTADAYSAWNRPQGRTRHGTDRRSQSAGRGVIRTRHGTDRRSQSAGRGVAVCRTDRDDEAPVPAGRGQVPHEAAPLRRESPTIRAPYKHWHHSILILRVSAPFSLLHSESGGGSDIVLLLALLRGSYRLSQMVPLALALALALRCPTAVGWHAPAAGTRCRPALRQHDALVGWWAGVLGVC